MKYCDICGVIMDDSHERNICECCIDDLSDTDEEVDPWRILAEAQRRVRRLST